jgi:hypothetical protein
MTHARERLGKHIPEVTLLTTEGRLKAGIVKSEKKCSPSQRLARARLPWNYKRFGYNTYMNNSSGTLEGGELYQIRAKL